MTTPPASLKERAGQKKYDAVVIGAGPNGLSAAIVLAGRGMRVVIAEAKSTIGGGCRSAELTEPGFIHDVCSSIHPLGIGSPFFRTLPLSKHGLKWVHPDAPYAHPFDGGKAVLVERSIEETGESLGEDARRFTELMNSLNGNWDEVCAVLLNPFRLMNYPFALARFGLKAMMPADAFACTYFTGPLARGTFAGVAAHSSLPLSAVASASIGLVLALSAHAVGWPTPEGGAQKLSDSLAGHLKTLGGEVVTDCPVSSIDELPESELVLCDVTPRQLLAIAGDNLRGSYRKQLEHYRYGPASFKMDWSLDAPIPWQAEECTRAGTVHIGATIEEIARSEQCVADGYTSDKPYVLLAQNSLFDPTRAPSGKHTAWAYCHVPNGSDQDMSQAIETQIERFAPGFKRLIRTRAKRNASALESYNSNLVGGDINGGSLHFAQLFTRPAVRLIPYSTPVRGLYICSSSTPPGSGVHGMSGYYAAMTALKGWSL